MPIIRAPFYLLFLYRVLQVKAHDHKPKKPKKGTDKKVCFKFDYFNKTFIQLLTCHVLILLLYAIICPNEHFLLAKSLQYKFSIIPYYLIDHIVCFVYRLSTPAKG